MVLPTSSPDRVGLLARDLLDQKSNSPLFPGARGELWLQMTSPVSPYSTDQYIAVFTWTLSQKS